MKLAFMVWIASLLGASVWIVSLRADVKSLLEMLNASRRRADSLNDVVARQRAHIENLRLQPDPPSSLKEKP
jgi:hypothetical protein